MPLQKLKPRPKGLTYGGIKRVEPKVGRPIQVLQVQGRRWEEFQQGTQSVFDYLLATLRSAW